MKKFTKILIGMNIIYSISFAGLYFIYALIVDNLSDVYSIIIPKIVYYAITIMLFYLYGRIVPINTEAVAKKSVKSFFVISFFISFGCVLFSEFVWDSAVIIYNTGFLFSSETLTFLIQIFSGSVAGILIDFIPMLIENAIKCLALYIGLKINIKR